MTIQELCADLGIECAGEGQHHHARSGWVQIKLCPHCGSSNYHLGYHLAGGYLNCYQCGTQDFVSTFRILAGKHGLMGRVYDFLKDRGTCMISTDPKQNRKGVYKPPVDLAFGGFLSQAHREYLNRRGLNHKEMVRLWDINGLSIAGRLSWRIFIPIYFRGKPVSWTTRSISETSKPRYIAAKKEEEAIPKSEVLYGLDFIRHACIVCEGPFDVWKIGPGAVCTFGLGYSRSQMMQLAKIPKRIICFDNEPQAQRRARKLADSLAPMDGQTMIVQLDSKDAGEATAKEIRRLRRLVAL